MPGAVYSVRVPRERVGWAIDGGEIGLPQGPPSQAYTVNRGLGSDRRFSRQQTEAERLHDIKYPGTLEDMIDYRLYLVYRDCGYVTEKVCKTEYGISRRRLAPVQAVVATIVSDADDYAKDVAAQLAAAGVRVETDLRNEKINYKVREHSVGKVPVILAIGMKEVEDRTVSVRRLGETQTQTMTLDAILAELKAAALAPDLR